MMPFSSLSPHKEGKLLDYFMFIDDTSHSFPLELSDAIVLYMMKYAYDNKKGQMNHKKSRLSSLPVYNEY